MSSSDIAELIGWFIGSFGLGLALGYLIALFKQGIKLTLNR